MYDIVGYGRMIADTGRTSSYAHALEMNITPGSVILDLGTGPGILALLACRSGAGKVYAVEPEDVIQLAREAAAANGFADRIQFVQASTTDIVLPEKVDGIVSDVRGVLPFFRTSVVSILDARDRFLKPRGWIVAARDTMWAALVSSRSLHNPVTESWTAVDGFDFSSASASAANQFLSTSIRAEDLLVPPQCWAVLEYEHLQDPNVTGELAWTMDRGAIGHGLGVWFDCETAPGLGFSNSPASGERHVYGHAFFPWPEATELMTGDRVTVRLRAHFVHNDYLWSWQTRVTEGVSGELRVAYRQSTFIGSPLSVARLRKRGHLFVPEPNDESRLDRRIIDLMDRSLTLCEIGSMILTEFPSRFKDWQAALAKVADLSERYSK
jgi:protein arginine N-methyltransferase 1